jgi:hypothetical protein
METGLCKYKDIFGKPNEGVHELRDPIFNIAVIDVCATAAGALVISWLFNFKFSIVLVILFIIGILAHKMFCVRTTIDKFLFNQI